MEIQTLSRAALTMCEFRPLIRIVALLALILGLHGALTRDAAAAEYRMERMPYPGKGINDHGSIILNCPCGTGGFSLAYVSTGKKTHLKQLVPPGFNPAVDDLTAVAINSQDQVLLHDNHTTTRQQFYFLYDIRSDSYRPIGLLGRFPDRADINGVRLGAIVDLADDGEILAVYSASLYGRRGPVLISGTVYGRPTLGAPGEALPPQEPADYALAPRINCGGRAVIVAMNAQHQFAGNCAFGRYTNGAVAKGFIYSNGRLTDVIMAKAVTTTVSRISADGRVVGEFQPQHTATTRAFVFDRGAYTALTTGGEYAFGSGINSSGQVVGFLKSHGIQGYLASPVAAGADEAAATPHTVPAARVPPAATTSAAAPAPGAPPAHGYMGTNAVITGESLTFTVQDPNRPKNGQTLTIGGLLPLSGFADYITEQQGRYFVVRMLGNGLVSVAPINNQKAGEQAYAQAKMFDSARHP